MNLEKQLSHWLNNEELMKEVSVVYNTMQLQRHQALPFGERQELYTRMKVDIMKHTEPPIDNPSFELLYHHYSEIRKFKDHELMGYD